MDFFDPEVVARHERVVELAERMLALYGRLAEVRIEWQRTVLGSPDPASDTCFVQKVLFAEDAFQVALLAFDHPAPHGDEY